MSDLDLARRVPSDLDLAQRVPKIKYLRERTFVGLREASYAVDAFAGCDGDVERALAFLLFFQRHFDPADWYFTPAWVRRNRQVCAQRAVNR